MTTRRDACPHCGRWWRSRPRIRTSRRSRVLSVVCGTPLGLTTWEVAHLTGIARHAVIVSLCALACDGKLERLRTGRRDEDTGRHETLWRAR